MTWQRGGIGGFVALLSILAIGAASPLPASSAAEAGRPGAVSARIASGEVYFFDDFEGGAGAWDGDCSWGLTGVLSRSAGHSMTDSPVGNYAPNSNCAVTLASPLDLSAADSPVLLFWHRGGIGTGGDYGRAQVSNDGGVTWSELRSFGTGGWYGEVPWLRSTWSAEQVDLSPWKSSSVLVRFLLTSDPGLEVEDGWYIDDVSIQEMDSQRLAYPFMDDLESGVGNWSLSGQDWGLVDAASRSASHSLTDSPVGAYLRNSYCAATLKHPLDLTGAVHPVLVFWHRGGIGTGGDYGHVQVSNDGGVTWSDLRSYGTGGWYGEVPWLQSTWSLEQADLSPWKSSRVLVRFLLTSDGGAEVADGWSIDDVEIRENKVPPATPYPFADTFESGLGNWTVSGSDWALTGTMARAGATSLTDSPGGYYVPFSDCSATLAHRIDLSGAAYPVLVFWHRGSVGPNDYWKVEASNDGGTSWAVLRQWSNWEVSTWSQEQVDLQGYRTDNVRVRFRLTANAADGEAEGWYVDDVGIRENVVPPATPFPFADSFESGLDNWTVSGSDWARTSALARAGVTSLTDSPGANYAPLSDCSATLTHRMDLSSAAYPVLVFWHRGSVGPNDYWSVEASNDGGTSWTPLKQWSNWEVSTWSQAQIDLQGYRTHNVKVRFRLTSNAGDGEAEGWYIDDVEIRENVVPPATPYPFADTFESGLGNWTVSGSDWAPTSTTARAGATSLTDSPGANYAPLSDCSATLTHRIDLSGAAYPVLVFWHRGSVGPNDYWSAEASNDGGTSWAVLRQWSNWDVSTWSQEQVDLQGYRTDNVRVRFRLTSNAGDGEAEGWYIDDVEIRENVVPPSTPFPFADSFESGLDNWTVSGSDWARTSALARAGVTSLTDSPGANYAPLSDCSATLTHRIDLTGTANPVLLFWHTGGIGPGDLWSVEVSSNGGISWTVLRQWSDWQITTWTQEQVELKDHRTNNVKVRFRITSNLGETVVDGWYVDDVRIQEKDTLRLAYPFRDDFENGLGAWTISGHDWDLTSASSRSGAHSLTDRPDGHYLPYTHAASTLVHPIDLSDAVSPVLEFWQRGTLGGGAGAYVQVSTDGGTNWGSLAGWGSLPAGFTPVSPYAPGQGDPVRFDLQPYRTSSVLIRFLLVSSGATEDGWYIDDVRIRESSDLTDVGGGNGEAVPPAFALGRAFPNPFNPVTTVSFELPQAVRVSLKIFDAAGRLVRTLANEERAAGHHEVLWDGADDNGGGVASGVYLCRLQAGSFLDTTRMTLVR